MKLTNASISSLLFRLLAFICILNVPTVLYYMGILSFKVIPLGIAIGLLLLAKKYIKRSYQLNLYLLFFIAYVMIGLLSKVVKDPATDVDLQGALKLISINIVILIATYQYACSLSDKGYASALNAVIFITLLGTLSIILSTPLGLDNITQINAEDYTRKSGVYLNANVGGFTAMTLMAFAFTNNFKNNTINMLLTGTALLAVFMGASKTSFVILFIFALIFLSKYKIRDINLKSVVSVIVISGIAYILLQDFLVGKNYDRVMQLGQLAQGNTSSDVTSSRLDLAKIALGVIGDNIVMGEGLYYFTALPAELTGFGEPAGVHNTYLLILGDSGFLPFLLFLFMLGSCIRTSYKYSRNNFLCYFFVAYAFFASVNHNLFDNSYVSFFVGFALASLARLHNSEQLLNNNEQLQLND